MGDYTISGNFLPTGWEMSNNENLIILYSLDGSHLEDDKLFEYTGDLKVVSAIVADWFESAINVNSIIIPEEYSLSAAYPNPFNPTTTLNFALPIEAEVSIQVFNLQGRQVISLKDGNMPAGYHSVVWNADSHASGVYFVKMVAGEYVSTQKLMLIK